MTSAEYIREQQYANDANLAARQAIYRFQQPPRNLHREALALAELSGGEQVLDVGCGNGAYLAALRDLGHRGPVVGVDLSAGMLSGPSASGLGSLGVGDAQRLPFVDDAFDCVLAMHMLYHVPDRALAIRELRRVLRPDGVLLAVTNSEAHLRELDDLITEAGGEPALRNMLRFKMENGGDELREQFARVDRHDFTGELVITEAKPLIDYIASMHTFVTGANQDLLPVIEARLATIVKAGGEFRITTAAGCFVCG